MRREIAWANRLEETAGEIVWSDAAVIIDGRAECLGAAWGTGATLTLEAGCLVSTDVGATNSISQSISAPWPPMGTWAE